MTTINNFIEPKLSIIIPAYKARSTIIACLTALMQSSAGINTEIIVVISANDGTEQLIAEHFPETRRLCFSERCYAGMARNRGAAYATGDILFFLDADCQIVSGALQNIITAHQRSAAAMIGGAFLNAEPSNLIGWSDYFASLWPWLPRSDNIRCERNDLASGCMTIKRWLFERCGGFNDECYGEDTQLCWSLRRQGYTLLFDAGICVYHTSTRSWQGLLTKRFAMGKTFAHLRIRQPDWSKHRRLGYALASPLIPSVLLCRAALATLKARRYFKEFILALPLTCLILTSWSLGEAVGYWLADDD